MYARATLRPSPLLWEEHEPAALVAEAVRRFRCISWTVFREYSELVLEEGPLDGSVSAPHLYGLSEPCQLTQCDVFFSHSWHDAKEQKWAALTQWCQTFEQRHSHTPQLLLDKVYNSWS